ncbi:MAG: hypothetical protein V3S97_07490 [Candidatus Bathyarchaeia archaeon]|jgi:uncharacterized membrane protein
MSALLVIQVFQHGPNGGFAVLQSYFWILLLVPILLTIFLLYRFFLPALNKVKVDEKMGNIVVKTSAEASMVESLNSKDANFAPETPVVSQEAPIDVARRLLESDEKQIVDALVKAGGSLLQKELSWETGFSRVKTHRILVD